MYESELEPQDYLQDHNYIIDLNAEINILPKCNFPCLHDLVDQMECDCDHLIQNTEFTVKELGNILLKGKTFKLERDIDEHSSLLRYVKKLSQDSVSTVIDHVFLTMIISKLEEYNRNEIDTLHWNDLDTPTLRLARECVFAKIYQRTYEEGQIGSLLFVANEASLCDIPAPMERIINIDEDVQDAYYSTTTLLSGRDEDDLLDDLLEDLGSELFS